MLINDAKAPIKQRSDLTYKYNKSEARHGWLRLTPAYSVKIVEGILADKTDNIAIFDPFSGTATTPLCSAMKGHYAFSMDINPFLVWLGKVKVGKFNKDILQDARDRAIKIAQSIRKDQAKPVDPPPISNINRWWDADKLYYLCSLKAEINIHTQSDSIIRDLLNVAFCRTIIRLSNAAFNHQSMSFQKGNNNTQLQLLPLANVKNNYYVEDVDYILKTASQNPKGHADIVLGDSRYTQEYLNNRFDLLITSPPYPNRISYIRELRPYMYWLGYLKEARETGELDWKAIGGTWDIATSRLSSWKRRESSFIPDYLDDVLGKIADSDSKSGVLLSNYVGKYFEDMWDHINSTYKVMKAGGEVNYIIGNSKFYNVIVPVERVYRDMLEKAGYNNVKIKIIRKRNSKKELYEFNVNAKKS